MSGRTVVPAGLLQHRVTEGWVDGGGEGGGGGGGQGGGGAVSDNLTEERPKGVEIFSVRPERRGPKNPDYNFLSMDL